MQDVWGTLAAETVDCQMDSVGFLKLPDTRATSKHHYVKDRLIMRLGI